MTNSISRQQELRNKIHSTNGKIFSTRFVKKDGSERKMVCRLGVKKHLKGGDSTTAHKQNLVTVFDLQKKAYRCINLETVIEISLEKDHETETA